jgi:peptide/nickel transport system permease protein
MRRSALVSEPAAPPAEAFAESPPAPARRSFLRFRASERQVGWAILAACLAASAIVPAFSDYDPAAMSAQPVQRPSLDHPFGTDELGRDVLTRVFVAVRVDLGITLVAVALCLVFGVAYGTVAGLSPARVRQFMQRLVDAIMAIPYLIIVLAIVAVGRNLSLPFVPPGVLPLILALWVTGWANYARITASQVQILAGRESTLAGRLLGYSTARLVVRHMLPSVLSPSLSLAGSHAVLITAAVASLSFLGAGVVPPTPELGAIMHGGTPLLATAWWISVFPGIVVVALGLGFSLISDSRKK